MKNQSSADTEARFTTTHWSMVLKARSSSSPEAEAAMEQLCRAYWPPLYAFVRREGLGVEDAQDLTQEFFRRLVWKEWREQLEPSDRLTADRIHDRIWAQAVLSRAADRLREEYVADGQEALFDQLKDRQPSEHGALSYADLGAQFGLSEQAVKNAMHRLRKRHREILREEIARTVGSPDQVDTEIRHLLAALNG